MKKRYTPDDLVTPATLLPADLAAIDGGGDDGGGDNGGRPPNFDEAEAWAKWDPVKEEEKRRKTNGLA
jgi:hypothetical protein